MGGFKIKVNRTYSCANVINIDGKDVVIPKGKINPPEGLPLVAPTEEDIMNRRKSLMHKLLISEQDDTHSNEGDIIFDDQRIKDSISELINSQRVEVFSGDEEPKFNIPEQGGQIVQPPHQTDDGAKQSAISLPEGKLAGESYTNSDVLSSDYQNNESKLGVRSTPTRTVEEIERLEELKQKCLRGLRMRGIIREDYNQDPVNHININLDAEHKTENEVIFSISTTEDETAFSYALICLRKGFNYDELDSVFSHISEFEKRFPYVANNFHRNMDDRSISMLRKGLIRAILQSGGKIKISKRPDEDKDTGIVTIPKAGLMSIGTEEDCKSNDSDNKSDCAYVVDEMGRVLFSDNRIRNTINDIINNPSQIQSNSSIIDEDNLKEKRERLKEKLLSGGKIKISKRSDEDKDVGTITIPKGGLMSIGLEEDCKSNDSDNKSDCAYVVDEMDSVLFSDNRIRNTINDIINNPSPIQSNSSIIDEDNLKEKRESLKKKLLCGEHINLKPKSDIIDSDSLLRLPGGVKL